MTRFESEAREFAKDNGIKAVVSTAKELEEAGLKTLDFGDSIFCIGRDNGGFYAAYYYRKPEQKFKIRHVSKERYELEGVAAQKAIQHFGAF